jgi:hypothetical protein
MILFSSPLTGQGRVFWYGYYVSGKKQGTLVPKGINNFAESGVKHVHAEASQTGYSWNPAPRDWPRN